MVWDGGGKGGKETFSQRKNKTKQTKKQFKSKKNFKSQNRDPKTFKKIIMHRGKPVGRVQQAAIVQCSAVQSEYRAYVLRESSAI